MIVTTVFCHPVVSGVSLAAVYIVLVAYLTHTCVLLVKRRRHLSCCRHPIRFCNRRLDKRARQEDSREQKVRQLVARERVRRIQRYALPFTHFFAFVVTLSACLPTLRAVGFTVDEQEHMSGCEWLHLLDFVLQLAACLTFAIFPKTVTSGSINFVYIFLTGWWILRALAEARPEYPQHHMTMVPVAFIERVILGLIACNAQVTTPCNVLITVVQCAVRFWLSCEDIGMQEKVDGLMMMDLTGLAFIVLALVVFEHAAWAACRHLLEVKTSSKTEVTVLRLLSALCDAVVTLGPDLRIVSRAPKLANLLLVGNHTRALEGSSFLDLMAETDRVRFRQFLAQDTELPDSMSDPPPAQALNVNLKDSGGLGVKVQLFHSHFQDTNDQVGHLIGICEVGDTTNPFVQVESLNTLAGASQNRSQEGGFRPSSSDEIELSDSASTRRAYTDLDNLDSESSLTGDSASSLALATAHFGCRSADLVPPLRSQSEEWPRRALPPPQEVSIAFGSLRFIIWQQQSSTPVVDASLLERESLQEWVTEWTSCRAWIQDLLNAALRPVHASSWPAQARPPSSLSFRVAFEGTCSLPSDMLSKTSVPIASPNIVGPPTLLTVSKVKLERRLQTSRSFSSERRGRSRRHHHHASVQSHSQVQSNLIAAGTAASGTVHDVSTTPTRSAQAKSLDVQEVGDDDYSPSDGARNDRCSCAQQ